MTTVETIQTKVIQLPPRAQEEVLEAVEEIEVRYRDVGRTEPIRNGDKDKHVLQLLAEIQIDGPADLSERHDFYAHGKLEE